MDFQASIDHLSQMLQFIRQEASQVGVEEAQIHKLELACEEALVNVISYAYPEKTGIVTIDCDASSFSRFGVTIRDQGPPFNPLEVYVDSERDRPMNKRKIGGLGIFLIRKMVDEMSYRRDAEENILKLAISHNS